MAILIHFISSIIVVFLLFFSLFSSATDTITLSNPLHDGATLVSSDGTFELGFFSPSTISTNRYVGIWYKNIPDKTVVWVANRENPTKDNTSMLAINTQGNLVLVKHNNSVLWSANSTKTTTSTIVKLLDSGNLVLKHEKDDDSDENYLWESFDYPTDTMLPGMKLGFDLTKGINRRLIAWRNWDDPSEGDLTWEFKRSENPEMVIFKGKTEYYRGGPFNGIQFSASPSLRLSPIFDFEFVFNDKELSYRFSVKNKSMITRMMLNQSDSLRESYTWNDEAKDWRLFSSVPRDYCDNYNRCGAFGECSMDQSPVCQCLQGFKPKSPEQWMAMDWSEGCVRSGNWSCNEKDKDGFLKFKNLKAPDTSRSWVNRSMTIEECKVKCMQDCNCSAFANTDIRGEGSGCAIWYGDLVDIRRIPEAGQDIYVRLAASEIIVAKDGHRKVVVAAVTTSVLFILVVVLTFAYICWRKRKSEEKMVAREENVEDKEMNLEVPVFDFAIIARATDNFSSDKKLGEGGFGPVYRGTLPDGQEIAVKRLSTISKQGLKEFKNEVILCAKLQHRNLVKVLGCCIHGEEKLLIYEFMPNKSLDSFLFDSSKSKLLDWSKRFDIICGVARGLLYLHQDSRLRIIHRDLKTSNVLLDNELNPKISDFGLARMVGTDYIEGNTSKVVGTYGYMAPEYAIDGLFSIKSDVFSFGITLLEIISGKKCRGISYTNKGQNLVGHAWNLWKEDIPEELIDACLGGSYVASQVLRCIQIALLCVQQHPEERPTMASVVVMLTSESAISQPNEPGILVQRNSMIHDYYSGKQDPSSTNGMSISLLEAR